MFACTIEAGMSMSSLDVCYTQVGPAQVPIPYPNMAETAMATPTTTKVFIMGTPALIKTSKVALSQGDDAGVKGGIMSGKFIQEMVFTSVSTSVMFEGKGVARFGDPTKNNKENAMGTIIEPSQSVVDVN
jgi:uncharacterized Zn-binding protein involved in type VI secretion